MKISFDFDDHVSGGLPHATGHVVFEPSHKHVHADNSLGTVRPFTVRFDKPFVVDLEATAPGWAWKITVTTGFETFSAYYVITRDEDYTKLVKVDPATLEPDAEPEPAWWIMARSTVNRGEVIEGYLWLTRADGTRFNAGYVQGRDGKDGEDGEDGDPGKPGLSPYQLAVLNGFIGSEQEWFDSLHGKDGLPGAPGLNGLNGTYLPMNTLRYEALPAEWAEGCHVMRGSSSGGWPFTCTVVTFRGGAVGQSAGAAFQLMADYATNAMPQIRVANGGVVNTWDAFRPMVPGLVTTTVAGLMSPADKAKLDAL